MAFLQPQTYPVQPTQALKKTSVNWHIYMTFEHVIMGALVLAQQHAQNYEISWAETDPWECSSPTPDSTESNWKLNHVSESFKEFFKHWQAWG